MSLFGFRTFEQYFRVSPEQFSLLIKDIFIKCYKIQKHFQFVFVFMNLHSRDLRNETINNKAWKKTKGK